MKRIGLTALIAAAAVVLGGCPESPGDSNDRPLPTARLFVVSNAAGAIATFADPQTLSGDVAPAARMAGAATLFDGPGEIVVTPSGALIVPNFLHDSISVFDGAAGLSGNVAPSRTARGIGVPATLAYDGTRDELYVGAPAGPSISVYAGVTTTAFAGTVSAARTISSTSLSSARGLLLSDGALYVADRASESILVFADAAALNGNVVPSRVIRGSPVFSGIQDLALDAAGRLYVVNSFAGRIDIFADPRGLDGAVAPGGSFRIVGGRTLVSLAISRGGTGYIADSAADAVYAIENIASRSGLTNAERTIKGPATTLDLPTSVFLVE